MKRILFYGRMTPVQTASPTEILLGNKFMSNPGNLLFAASVARTVMTGDVELVSFFSEDIEGMLSRITEINESYECVVIPLANAFRPDYREKLRKLTRFVKAVRLPCHVIGVGVQASNLKEFGEGVRFPFDEDAKQFVAAILEKSPLLGVRGEFTAEYLKGLGFVPEQHFTMIGCPSAYIYGETCRKIHVKPFDEIEKVSINAKLGLPKGIDDLIGRSMTQFRDVHFVAQNLYECWAMVFPYKRSNRTRRNVPQYYPYSKEHPLWREGRVVAFLRSKEWLDFMQQQDFSFGSRFHGNLAAVTAGTPAIIAVSDLRILEMARYHGIAHVWKEDIHPETQLRDLYEKADFGAFERKYINNFAKYVDFLNRLGLEHIYDGKNVYAQGEAPYDRALPSDGGPFMIHSCMEVSFSDKLKGLGIYPLILKYKMDRRKFAREK